MERYLKYVTVVPMAGMPETNDCFSTEPQNAEYWEVFAEEEVHRFMDGISDRLSQHDAFTLARSKVEPGTPVKLGLGSGGEYRIPEYATYESYWINPVLFTVEGNIVCDPCRADGWQIVGANAHCQVEELLVLPTRKLAESVLGLVFSYRGKAVTG